MQHSASRRTTLTLPSRCLDLAEQIARERHLNLSSVVGEALSRGLREEEQLQRSETILQSYKKAFAGFSAEELLLLDGIVTALIPSEKSAARKRRVGKIRRLVRK
jgi:hypothetical protein